MTVNWYIGTMGFSYNDWYRVFYPENIGSRKFLAYYSRIFNCVEIDSSFYGTPRKSSMLQWKGSTPDEFRICLKTPRAITHELAGINARALMHEFVDAIRVLDNKLGIVLLQFPPSFTVDNMGLLETFLQVLPQGIRYAVEIRSASWYTQLESLVAILREYHICLSATEYPGLSNDIHLTSDFLYIRWIGQHGSFQHHTHERFDRSQELELWSGKISKIRSKTTEIFGFFNNDYAGFAPGTANRFKALAEIPLQDFTPPVQPSLF